MEQEQKPKSVRFKIGVVLFVISTITFALLLVVPILDVSFEAKAEIAFALVIVGEVLFWISAYLLGKEIYQKYKSYLNPANWFKKKENEPEDKS